jgi:hypothetical protein
MKAINRILSSLLNGVLLLYAVGIAAQPAGTVAGTEASLHGSPVLLDLLGQKRANGEFVQWREGDVIHVRIDYDFGGGHRIEEKASFRDKPQLIQTEWTWNESQNGEVLRHFEVDFKSGKAVAEKREDNKVHRWSKNIKVEPGRTFAGFGFALAISSLRDQLVKGADIELEAVGFTPKPHVVEVKLSYNGLEQMTMGGRPVKGDRFTIHAEIPAIARAFVATKDTHIWLNLPPTVDFLRWEGPLVEVGDPVVRVDRFAGGQSGPAAPAGSER